MASVVLLHFGWLRLVDACVCVRVQEVVLVLKWHFFLSIARVRKADSTIQREKALVR